MINLNKYNIKSGDTVILDQKFNNASQVVVKNLGNIYATVQDENGNEWDVMINRLTPLPDGTKKDI